MYCWVRTKWAKKKAEQWSYVSFLAYYFDNNLINLIPVDFQLQIYEKLLSIRHFTNFGPVLCLSQIC